MSSDGQQEQSRHVGRDRRPRSSSSGTPFVTIGGNMAQGATYVFVEPSTGWRNATETQKLSSNDGKNADGLGQSVGLSNGTVLAASPGSDVPGHADAGAIYAFGPFPTSSISLSPAAPNGSNGWYRSAVRVTVRRSDTASTVTDSLRGPTWRRRPRASSRSRPLPVRSPAARLSNTDVHAVYAAASNTAGYARIRSSRTFKIDTSNPTVKCVAYADVHPPRQGRAGGGDRQRLDVRRRGLADRRPRERAQHRS